MDANQLRSAIATMRTVPISTTAASGDATIHATAAGLYFVVFHLFVNTSAAMSLTIKSGTTALSGAIPMSAITDLEWSGGDVPLFKGRASGDAFILNASGSTNLRGFCVICEAT
jgi:hypothetical protein